MLYPGQCLLCTSRTTQCHDLCAHCADSLPWLGAHCRICALPLPTATAEICGGCLGQAPAFDRTTALFTYRAPVDHLIAQIKFGKQLLPARLFGTLLADKLQPITPAPELLIPVPLHPRRLKERGFNQAFELCRWIRRQTGIPIDTGGVIRALATSPQAQMSRIQRRHNIRRAFQLKGNYRGLHVALVDDVMTSGNTLSELARTVRQGGARKVDLVCVARAEMTSA